MTNMMPPTGKDTRKGIFWIASYPKSGNTWTRILLSNLVGRDDQGDDPFALNLTSGISSDRHQFDDIVGLPSSDLSADEVDLFRPDLYGRLAETSDSPVFVKVHEGYLLNPQGRAIFPPECSLGVIYLVRNPLDVAISFSHHQGHDGYDIAIRQINAEARSSNGWTKRQLRQQLLGWQQHYRTWHEQTEIPVLTVSYEDMLADTAGCLRSIARFAGLQEGEDAAKINRAVEMSSFKNLQRAEQSGGFREKPEQAEAFFRSGRSGEGREKLSQKQQDKIIDSNRALMHELGYL